MAIKDYFPIYRLSISGVDGLSRLNDYETEEEAREAFAGAQGATFNMYVELIRYAAVDADREVLAEWTRPSIFNLD